VGSKSRKPGRKKASSDDDFEKLHRDFARGWYERSGAYGSISRTKTIELPKPRKYLKNFL